MTVPRWALATVYLLHPWRTMRAWARHRGWMRTVRTYYCPGCGYRSRRWPRVRAHACEATSRAGRRRIERARRQQGTVHV